MTLLLLPVALSTVACSQNVKPRELLLSEIEATAFVSRHFDYSEQIHKTRARVDGDVQDGLKYQETLSVGGNDALQVVVDDDALGVRVIDPSALPALDSSAIDPTLASTLKSGQWVVDPSGAPPLAQAIRDSKSAGFSSDPVKNAIDVLVYVSIAVSTAADIHPYRPDDISPAYRAKEDHFPQPQGKIGEKRFDLVRTPLPSFFGAAAGGIAAQPRISNFRKMAIYVRDNKVTKVIEDIDIDGHPDVIEARKKHKKRLLDLIKQIKAGATQEKIIPRKMAVTFTQLGKEPKIEKPANALIASLKGVLEAGAQGAGGTGAPAPATPATPEAPAATETAVPDTSPAASPATSP